MNGIAQSGLFADLPAPRYALDSFDHGISRKAITQGERVAVFFTRPLPSLQAGDVLYLFFGYDLNPLATVYLDERQSGQEIRINVPADQIMRYVPDNQRGRYDIWFAIVRGLESLDSEPLQDYLIDLQPPGGIPTPDPPLDGINPSLLPIPELTGTPRPQPQPSPGRSFIMTVPPWQNMTVNDKLYVRWGSQPILGPYLIQNGDLGRPYEVIVPGPLIGTEGVPVSYYIVDEVNNESYNSKPQDSLSDGDGGDRNLRAPSVSARLGAGPVNLIPADALDVDALATIPGMSVTEPPVPIFRAGDEIQLYWDDTPVGLPINVTTPGIDLNIFVPSTVLKTHSPGVWNVWYEARRSQALPPSARSPGQLVEVKAAGGLLPGDGRPLRAAKWLAPTRRPDDPARQILPSDVALDEGTKLRIYQYTNMAPGDRLDMLFEGHEELDPRSRVLPGTTYPQTYVVTPNDLIEKEDDSVRPPVSAVFIDVHVPKIYFSPFQKFGSATFEYEATNAAGQGFSERNFIGDHYVYVAIR
ncbi:hypothetical protein KCV01_g19377, partial [Aureobasidium melanogenum]